MTLISLDLPQEELALSNRFAKSLHLSRAEYLREAIRQRNLKMEKERRDKRMADVSRRVRKESMRVNAEFSAIETDSDA